MTLRTVGRQHMYSAAAVFMTTVLNGCNLLHFLVLSARYVNIRGGLASSLMSPIVSCVSYTLIPIRFRNLSPSFMTNINIS